MKGKKMKQLGEVVKEVCSTAKTAPLTLPQESSMAVMPRETHNALAALIDQSFDVFDIYGKKPEQIENILMAFNLALAEFSTKQITDAFLQWMKAQEVFPKPASIRNLIVKNEGKCFAVADDVLSYPDFKARNLGGWEEYKQYQDKIRQELKNANG